MQWKHVFMKVTPREQKAKMTKHGIQELCFQLSFFFYHFIFHYLHKIIWLKKKQKIKLTQYKMAFSTHLSDECSWDPKPLELGAGIKVPFVLQHLPPLVSMLCVCWRNTINTLLYCMSPMLGGTRRSLFPTQSHHTNGSFGIKVSVPHIPSAGEHLILLSWAP